MTDGMALARSSGEEDQALLLKASWNSNASSWTEAVRTGGIASRRLVTDQAIVETVLARSPRSLLDVGCGEGWLCRAVAQSIPRIVGVDGSAELVEQARLLGDAEFIQLSYDAMRGSGVLSGERFDVVVANFAVLDENLTGFLEAMRGLVADGGCLIIQTLHPCFAAAPYRSGWRTEDFASFIGNGNWQPMPWYFRTLGDWLGALRHHWQLRDLIEPLHPETERPASLILVADPL